MLKLRSFAVPSVKLKNDWEFSRWYCWNPSELLYVKKSSGTCNLLPKPMVTPVIWVLSFSSPSSPFENTFLYKDTLNEVGFLPPSHGSVFEKLYPLYNRPFDWALIDYLCPSPPGNGVQASFLKNFFVEIFLKVKPSVPINLPEVVGPAPP